MYSTTIKYDGLILSYGMYQMMRSVKIDVRRASVAIRKKESIGQFKANAIHQTMISPKQTLTVSLVSQVIREFMDDC